MYLTIKSRYQEKAALPTSVPMLSTEIKRSQQCRFSCIKKQKSESAICQSLNNPRMGFSVLYKMISNEPGPVESETPGPEMEKNQIQKANTN